MSKKDETKQQLIQLNVEKQTLGELVENLISAINSENKYLAKLARIKKLANDVIGKYPIYVPERKAYELLETMKAIKEILND